MIKMKKNGNCKEYYVFKIYVLFYLFSSIFIGVSTIINYQMYGEAMSVHLTLDKIDLIFLLILHCSTLLATIPLFKATKNLWIRFKKNHIRIYFVIDKKINVFVFIVLFLQLLFSLYSGNGVVGQDQDAPNSIIALFMNMLKISQFMPIYYVVARNVKKKIYWLNIMLWLIYQLACGWSQIILQIFILEFYLRIKTGSSGKFVQLLYKLNVLVSPILLMGGAIIYKYAWALKNTIRNGYIFLPLNYPDALSALISRFTSYPITVTAFQNQNKISALYQLQGIRFADIRAIFRPLLPGILMPNKSFRTLNNLVMQSIYPNITNTTSSGYCPWLIWWNLFSSDILDFLVYVVIFLLLFIISKTIIYMFDDGTKNVEILYFLLVFQFLSGSSAETMFGYGYIGLIYFIPIMVFFKIIRIKKGIIINRRF